MIVFAYCQVVGASVQLLKFAIDDNIIQNSEKRYTIMNRLGYLCFCILLCKYMCFLLVGVLLKHIKRETYNMRLSENLKLNLFMVFLEML